MTSATARIAVPDTPVDVELAALAKAFGHPARIAILRLLLSRGAQACGEVVEHLPLAQATVSQHPMVLADVRLIEGEIDGPRTYWASRERIERLHELVAAMLAEAVLIPERQGDGCR